MAPRQNFVKAAAAVCIKGWIKSAFLKGLKPAVVVELIVPTVEFAAFFKSAVHDFPQPPVSACEDRL